MLFPLQQRYPHRHLYYSLQPISSLCYHLCHHLCHHLLQLSPHPTMLLALCRCIQPSPYLCYHLCRILPMGLSRLQPQHSSHQGLSFSQSLTPLVALPRQVSWHLGLMHLKQQKPNSGERCYMCSN